MNAPVALGPDVQRAKLTAQDFRLLADAGAFESYRKTELIEGEIWVVNSVWRWHARTTAHFTVELGIALRSTGSALVLYDDGSVDLSDDSVPQPDICVGADEGDKSLPLSAVRLAIEVSDSTSSRDLGLKVRLYGSAGIPEYWVVDRERARVVQMWSPQAGGYAERREVPFGEPVNAQTLVGIIVDTAAIPA